MPDLQRPGRSQDRAHRVLRNPPRTVTRGALVQRPRIRILAGVAVTDIFLDEESQGLAMLSDFIGKPILPKAEPSYTQEQYDIVLL